MTRGRLMECEVKRQGRTSVESSALNGSKEDQGVNRSVIKGTCRSAGGKQSVVR